MIRRILSPFKALRTLRKTALLLDKTLTGVTQRQAADLRDGPDGWSILFIACHLRDYERFLRQRVELVLADDQPVFHGFDQVALVAANAYADQELGTVLAELREGRAALIARLEVLDDTQWLREGINAEQGPGSVLDLAINAGLHDLDHLEQLTRCLDVPE